MTRTVGRIVTGSEGGRECSVSAVEFHRQAYRTSDAYERLPRCCASAPYVGHPASHGREGLCEFDSGQVRPEAVMEAAAEGEHRRGPFAGEVEPLRLVVDCRVVVRRRGIDDDERARRDGDTAEFDVLNGDAHRHEDDR